MFTPFRMCVYVYAQQHVWLLAQACALFVISEPLCFVCNQRASTHLPFPLANAFA